MRPSSIAILGGGLTGLSSAFHLVRRYPSVPITLVERSLRLGGWVRSERVQVHDNSGNTASVLLEVGPRTLRPNGKSVLELINLLGLETSLLKVPRSSPAARNRFLHIPGTDGLTVIPASLLAMLSSPLSRILIPAIVGAAFRSHPPPYDLDDQSFDAFLTTHFGVDFARTFGSALVHGIYAADSRRLSVRAAFPSLWEAGQGGNIVRGFTRKAFRWSGKADNGSYELDDLLKEMQGVSVYSFRDGMETVVRTLHQNLGNKRNIEIVTGDQVLSLGMSDNEPSFVIKLSSGRCIEASHVVCALPLQSLDKVLASGPLTSRLSPRLSISALNHNPLSSVTVVNIVFPPTSFPIHPCGFGYLVPRPRDQATQREIEDHANVLGVVFDSCALPEQDVYPSVDAPRFTKVTMMLGGPHVFSHTPESVTTDKLLRILTRHLAPPQPLPEPVLIRARHLTGCIPTPTVGHVRRITDLKEELRNNDVLRGRLEVVGAGVGGVSVPDCIEQGRHVGSDW